MVLPLFAITPLLLHWQCLPRCLQLNLMKQELRMNLFLKKLSFDRLKLQLWLTSCCCCYDGWDNDRSGDRKIPGLKSVKYLNFSLDIQMFLLKKNCCTANVLTIKGDWKLPVPCTQIVQIFPAGTLQFLVPIDFMIKKFAVWSDLLNGTFYV